MRGVALGMLLVIGLGCATPAPPPPVRMDLPENPLPACPGTPNCVRETRLLDGTPEQWFDELRVVLDEMGAVSVETNLDDQRLDAVFRAFVFKDDVAVQVGAWTDSTAVHIRSASRVGYSDLGVNRRRVADFWLRVEALR